MQQDSAGIGCKKFQREAETRIIELLARARAMTFGAVTIEILENVPMRLTQIKKLANEMKFREVISFELPQGKRVPQPETQISLAS